MLAASRDRKKLLLRLGSSSFIGDAANGSSSVPRISNVAEAVAVARDSAEPVQARGDIGVRLGQFAVGVIGQREPHLVPPVHEDVGVSVGLLRRLGDPIDERDRLGEVLEPPLADDLLSFALPGEGA
jgi:hypothetical protein